MDSKVAYSGSLGLIYDWQSMVSGVLALFAALIVIWFTRKQARSSEQQTDFLSIKMLFDKIENTSKRRRELSKSMHPITHDAKTHQARARDHDFDTIFLEELFIDLAKHGARNIEILRHQNLHSLDGQIIISARKELIKSLYNISPESNAEEKKLNFVSNLGVWIKKLTAIAGNCWKKEDVEEDGRRLDYEIDLYERRDRTAEDQQEHAKLNYRFSELHSTFYTICCNEERLDKLYAERISRMSRIISNIEDKWLGI